MFVWYSLNGRGILKNYLVPFYFKFVVKYLSKYNSKEFDKFVFILNKVKEKSKFDKNEITDLVKWV